MMTNEDSDMDALYNAKPKPRPKPKSVDEQEQMAPTHLIDKKAFPGGCEVGQKYTIEVVAEHGEEAEVKVVDAEKEPEKPAGDGESEAEAPDELAEMNNAY